MTIFQCEITHADGIPTLRLAGELDLFAAPAIEAARTSLLADPRAPLVHIDCAGVTFLDCAALGALLELGKRACGAGTAVQLRAVPACMQRVLAITGPHTYVTTSRG